MADYATNVGEVPLKINLKPASGWSPGLARPIQVTIRVGSEPNKIVPITDENWRVGITLNTEVPIGQTATIMMTTIATGEPDQVLQAAVEMNGNFLLFTQLILSESNLKIKKLWHQMRKVLSAHQLLILAKSPFLATRSNMV